MQKPKGTYDMFGKDSETYLYFNKIVESLMDKYNYKYFQTPIFESSDLFHRGVGETTDIVSKETYDFKDRGDRNLTLRPEGTAGLVRSFIENKLYVDAGPLKSWYFGSMFRYERPQSGRNREFTQFGVEAFGSNDPMLDAEVISIVVNLFKILGLKGIKVNINTLGDTESRIAYRKALLDYFKPYLKIIKDCGFEAGCFPNSFYKNLNGTDSVNFITRASKNYMVILNDGSAISFMLERIEYVDTPITQLGIIYYDINGPKPPNTFGKDIFQVHITPEGIKLPDYMKMSQKMERCYETGYSCMGWVIKYGNLDYLHCDDL